MLLSTAHVSVAVWTGERCLQRHGKKAKPSKALRLVTEAFGSYSWTEISDGVPYRRYLGVNGLLTSKTQRPFKCDQELRAWRATRQTAVYKLDPT